MLLVLGALVEGPEAGQQQCKLWSSGSPSIHCFYEGFCLEVLCSRSRDLKAAIPNMSVLEFAQIASLLGLHPGNFHELRKARLAPSLSHQAFKVFSSGAFSIQAPLQGMRVCFWGWPQLVGHQFQLSQENNDPQLK